MKRGSLLRVKNATGVRAGALAQTSENEAISRALQAFATIDAYEDPGYWYIFYQVGGLVATVRILNTKSSGKDVGFLLLGHSTSLGLQLISSLGTLVLNGPNRDNEFECRIQSVNYYDSGQIPERDRSCSSYFIAIQKLVTVKPKNISAAIKDRINVVIDRDITKINLDRIKILNCD